MRFGLTRAGLVLLGGTCLAAGCGGSSGRNNDGDIGAAGSAGATMDVAAGATVGAAEDAADAAVDNDGSVSNTGFRSLFPAADWQPWDRYLGKPSNNPAAAEEPLGLNNDPQGVFSIVTVDGLPAVHVTGQVFGSLISKETFCKFHLRAQFKWGTKFWPPYNALDSGIMFLSTGPLGAVQGGGNALANPIGNSAYMVAIEYQLVPGGAGPMYNLGPIAFDSASLPIMGEVVGAWNQVDIVFDGTTAVHTLNGAETGRGTHFVLNWPGQDPMPLACGKLQLQSEGGEIFFRNIEIQTVP